MSPLRNGTFGHSEPSRKLDPSPEVLNCVLREHERKFSALDTECKMAELRVAVAYSPMSETRGQRIRAQRRMKRLTQQQLADKIGVSKGLISQWEKDQIEHISHPNWMGLLAVLGVDAEMLEFGPDERPSVPGEGAGRWRKRGR